jgi:polyisoprenyl-teichoic acid--peptidoglycan teichoic acid transferase
MIPRSRRGMLWRFLAAAIVIVGATAATTAVAGLLQFKQLAVDLSVTPALPHANVTLPSPGAPQTLLIVGSDHRAGEPYSAANTDTMMLVRLNPASSTVNVLSIPRDLEVQIPGYGTAKINAAYSDGGPNLMIQTIKDNVFPALKVNHILDVNFAGFSDLVDAIGCVYSAVDHRYYNNTALTDFSSIDIQPGYQKLCGDNQSVSGALAFVRFRHTDTDIVRNARQQDFIRWAKDQYSTTQLLDNRDRLLRIFGSHVQTDRDLHSIDGLINLFNLVLNMSGHTIKSVPFPAQLQPCVAAAAGQAAAPCYVTAESSQEAVAFTQFMKPTTAVAAAAKTHPAVKVKTHKHGGGPVTAPGLIPDVPDGRQQASELSRVAMPVYYPKLIVSGATYCSAITGNCDDGQEPASEYEHSYPRAYTIHDRQGAPHAAYYMTVAINQVQGQYYGVQGTTWLNPPLLASPSQTKVVDGKKLELFAAGGKLTTVAWRTPTAVYWIDNTLTNTIGNQQMVALAASLTRATG